jgi:hypothetical protein
MLDLPLRGDEREEEGADRAPERSQPPPPEPRPRQPEQPEDPDATRRLVVPEEPPTEPQEPTIGKASATIVRERRHPRKRKRRKRWPLYLLLLVIAGGAFAVYRFTTPVAGFSTESLDFGEQLVGGTSEPQPVTVTNEGSRGMSVTGARFRREAASDFEVVGDGCSGATRAAGEECTLQIVFKPTANGPRQATLALSGNVLGQLPVTGTGAAPVLSLDRTEIDFGPQPVDGRGANRTLVLSNDGAAPLPVGQVLVEGDHANDFTLAEECSGGSIAAGESCDVRIGFTPRAAGERLASVRVESEGSGQSMLVSLKGMGAWSGKPLDAAPAEVDFGRQRRGRESDPVRIAFINRTAEPVPVGDARIEAGSSGIAIARQDCQGVTLPAGDECVVELSFTPTAEGAAGATLTVSTAEGLETAVELRGRGVEPRLELEKGEVDFGGIRVGFEKSGRAVLTNTGSDTLTFSEAFIDGSHRSAFSKRRDGCSGFSLQPGRTCTIGLSFQPTSTGTQRAQLHIDSDAAGGRQSVALEGRGTSAQLAVDLQTLDFGTVQRPGTADRTLTIKNNGNARLQIQRVSVTGAAAGDFAVSSIGCGESGLAGGDSCGVTVRFVPRDNGVRTARLVIQHDAGGPAMDVDLRGTALAAVPGFSVSNRAVDFGSRAVGTRSAIDTITVSNPGDGRLVVQGISIEGAHANDFTIVPGTCDGAPYVAPRGSCTIGVRFTPRAAGSRTATLRIRHNASGDGSVRLSGQGTQ